VRCLGISAYYHDSAAALVEDGRIVAAAQEERFSRRKHDRRFPRDAVRFCLEQAKGPPAAIDHVAFYDKPLLKFERLLETYLATAPFGFASFRRAMPIWLREKLFLRTLLEEELERAAPGVDWAGRILFAEHHQSHAASAFFPSPFGAAAILTMDGVGEWATTSAAVGSGDEIRILREIRFPHSLGLLYSAFTGYVGFKVNSGEYKTMGLAPFGTPRWADLVLDRIVDVKEDGSFRLDLSYFDYCAGLSMTSPRFHDLFGGPPRAPDEPVTQRHMDLAASIQRVTEEIVLRLARALARDTGLPNLCLAGGVALNCVANGKLRRERVFERIWIQPAAGDDGGALGAALAAHHGVQGHPRSPDPADSMRGALLGPSFTQEETEARLRAAKARFRVLAQDALVRESVDDLAAGRALGWFQGRMEFGPRALGARSILADARSPTMQSVLNLKVKFRESFRPFAPAVLRERVSEWFDLDEDSPYMLFVAEVAASRLRDPGGAVPEGLDAVKAVRSEIPAVTHVDRSARIQTVDAGTNPLFHALLEEFERRTGCPVLVNTSFNVRGEPIVHTPEEAFACFMGTGIETLAIGRCLLRKEDQDPALATDRSAAFAKD
jgi:carbamoyltransferase